MPGRREASNYDAQAHIEGISSHTPAVDPAQAGYPLRRGPSALSLPYLEC
jgi:hypothetical protein